MLRGLHALIAAMVAALFVAAAALPASAASEIDGKQLAQQVSSVVTPVYPDLQVGAVSCPKHVPRTVGVVVLCNVVAGPVSLEMKVTLKDRVGNVSVESTQAVIPKAKAEAFVQNNATLPAQVDCGADAYVVRPPGAPFACTVRFSDGTTRQVAVAVNDVAGNATIVRVL